MNLVNLLFIDCEYKLQEASIPEDDSFILNIELTNHVGKNFDYLALVNMPRTLRVLGSLLMSRSQSFWPSMHNN